MAGGGRWSNLEQWNRQSVRRPEVAGGSSYINAEILTDAQTIAGNSSFTSPTGTSETGHTGNGYARITCLD